MSTLLLQHADLLVTMDAQRRQIKDGALFVRDQAIEQVGPTASLPASADTVINARGMIVLPGLVNTHHHLYQSLTRALAQDSVLFAWLKTLYPIWARLTPEAVYLGAKLGLAELMLSGCTTSSDHHYLWPHGSRIDDEIEAAGELGIRFHASRGSMSLGESQGGLPPDSVVEDEDAILADCRRAIETFHQRERFGMVRIVVAPCSPFSVTPDLMRESAALARSYGVRLHTHLAETKDEEEFCLARFGRRPVAYAEDLGWTGRDVWHAHCVHLSEAEIDLFVRTGTGAAHCPSSNMRLGSGIAPIRRLLDRGASVGLGVDGSASNDGAHLLGEARQAMLLQRVLGNPAALTAQEALELATLGGAAVLGRDDIGALAPGMAADFIGLNLNRLAYSGALHDPLAAVLFCAAGASAWTRRPGGATAPPAGESGD
ncbi:8-oxoguanine deaminase [Candidatus Amarolinea dominans]|uniref:8-oxoguanine deaminase n=1 Tax=Candidatus Amarolinea dominans TaxID=3140696 RepID=UPI003134CAC7|nr:8-oxoguanine deaminase [Anaerolineae bacterium]